MYYDGVNLKQNSSFDIHCDFVYSPTDGSFDRKDNFQGENTPAVIYSIGDHSVLKWKKINIVQSKWLSDRIFLRRIILIVIL